MCRLDFSLPSNMFLNVLFNMTNKLSRRTISIWDHGLHLHLSSASASLFSVCKLMLTSPPSYQQLILRKDMSQTGPIPSYRRSSCNFYFLYCKIKVLPLSLVSWCSLISPFSDVLHRKWDTVLLILRLKG